MMKVAKGLLLFVLALVVGVGAAAADDGDDVPTINDGRVNSWDIAAPVVVYCTFEYPDADDPDAGVFSTVELWSVVRTDGVDQGSLALEVSAEEIDAAGYSSDADTLIASASGFSLYRASDASLFVTAPADAEGKVYRFSWEFGDQGC
jgi:hypothetical protein